MRKIASMVAMIALLASCAKEELPVVEVPGETPSVQPEAPLRTISVGASSDASATKTTLSGYRVLWDAGDEFMLAVDSAPALQVTVDGMGQGMGMNVNAGSVGRRPSTVQIVYSDIKVTLGGVDVTDQIVCADSEVETSTDNAFYLGIPNSNDKYRYPAPGTAVTNNLKGYGSTWSATLVRMSSSNNPKNISTTNPAVVTLKGVRYKTDRESSWNDLTSSSNIVNGTSHYARFKDVASLKWLTYNNVRMALASDAGLSHGLFTGTTTATGDLDESTRAVFPYSAFSSYASGNINLSLPATQSYVEDSFDHAANVMVGYVEETPEGDYDAKFRNVMGVLKLTLTGDCTLSKIELTDKGGKSLWGNATLPADGFESGLATDMLSGGSSTLTLNCSGVQLNSTPKAFYFVVPVGAFSGGLSVTATDENGLSKTFSSSKANTIAVSDIKAMPAFAVTKLAQEFNVENVRLTEYLDKDHYTTWGGTSHFATKRTLLSPSVTDFGKSCVGYDRPAEYSLTWNGSSVAAYDVDLVDETASRTVFASRSVAGTSLAIYNLVPGHTYVYTVKDGSDVVKTGRVKATGRVRMLRIEDSWNCRDLGGWTGLDGRKVVFDKLLRTGSLNGVWQNGTSKVSYSSQAVASNYVFSATARQQLQDLGIVGELDLRSTAAAEGSGTDYSHAVTLGASNTGIDGWMFKNIAASGAMSNPTTDAAFVKSVAWLIEQVNSGNRVAFHCKSGADRTGGLGFTILALLGVDLGEVAYEFELTNMSREQGIVKGSAEIRGKYTFNVGDNFYTKGITTMGQGSFQKNAYYYLNQYFASDLRISSDDLDAFIANMLGLSEYHQPGGVSNSNTLSSIYNHQ